MMLLSYKECDPSLPSLGLSRCLNEIEALDMLHDFIFTIHIPQEADNTYDACLDSFLYPLLKAMWFHKLDLRVFIECTTDVALAIMCLNRNGSFKVASQATQQCAGLNTLSG